MYQANTSWATGQQVAPGDMNRIEAGVLAATTNLGFAPLDSFPGASDDAMLTAAMSYAAAQTHPPIIKLSNRNYTFSGSRTPYDGFRLEGCGKLANSEQSDVNMYTKINVSGGPFWLNAGSQVENCYVGGIAAIGNSSTSFIGGSGMWFGLHMRDVSFHSFLSVCGSQSQKMIMSCCLFDGWWQIQGCYNGAVHVGGSDSRLWTGGFGCLADATPAYNTAGNAAGQYHFWFDYMDNTTVGPLYITAEGPWGGVRVSGPQYNTGIPSNRGEVVIYGSAIEGRNASQPCYGSVVRVDGGALKLRDAYIGRAMSSPATMGHTPQDAGYIHVSGGSVLIDGMTVDKYTGQAESVPVVYNNGGHVRVLNTDVATKGGVWSNPLPLVTGVTYHDDTVRDS